MRFFTLVIAMILISPQANANIGHAAKLCGLYFSPYRFKSVKNDLERLEFINRLEKTTAGLRSSKVNPREVEVVRQIQEEIAQLDTALFQMDFGIAHTMTKTLFREVEVNFVISQKQSKVLKLLLEFEDKLKPDEMVKLLNTIDPKRENQFFLEYAEKIISRESIKEAIKELQKKIRKSSVIIGNNYQRYKLIRSHLEKIANEASCNASCRTNVGNLLDNIGVRSANEQNRFPGLLSNVRPPSILEIESFIHSSPAAYEANLFKESVHEAKAILRDFVTRPGERKSFLNFLERKLPKRKNFFTTLFNNMVDYDARINHFPHIHDIIRFDGDTPDKMFMLKDINTTFQDDSFLISFARRTDQGSSEAWQSISNYAKKNDNVFFERMLSAELKAQSRGEIPITQPRSRIATLAFLVTTGLGATFYLNFDKVDTVESTGEPQGVTVVDVDIDTEDNPSIIVTPEEADAIESTIDQIRSDIEEFKKVEPKK